MNEITKKIQIVVARYNEDTTWLLPYKDIVTIYNKGNHDIQLNNFNTIRLQNIGRESHTYLTHIINNYDNLSEKTLFVQGKISDHKILNIMDYFKTNHFIGVLDELDINLLKTNIDHIKKWKKEYLNGTIKKCILTPYVWITQIIGIDLNNIDKTNVVWGANFSISKELILSKPKIFYENIIRYIGHINPEEGHYLERSWYMIFNYNYIEKDLIGYMFNDNIDIDKYKEIHIWKQLSTNSTYNMINYIPEGNNKFLNISRNISRNISIKSFDDIYILIDSSYEIILKRSMSVIIDCLTKKIIDIYQNQISIPNFKLLINDDKITIKNDDNIIFNITGQNIEIKSYKDIFLEYECDSKIKYHLYNSQNDIKVFYEKYYLQYYVKEIR